MPVNNDLTSLLSHSLWTSPIDMYIGDIVEYDMSDGGFSIIKEERLLPEALIQRLENIPKGFERNEAVGKLKYSKDPQIKGIGKLLEQKFKEYRIWFGDVNDLTVSDIFSIKRDAVFLKRYVQNVKRGKYIEFKEKHTYDVYCLLGREPLQTNLDARYRTYEVYYNTYTGDIAIKGISDALLDNHQNGMISIIKKYLKYIVTFNFKSATKFMVETIERYKFFDLPIECYREFNSTSLFPIQMSGKAFMVEVADRSMIPYLDIRYNFNNILVPMLNLVSTEHQPR